MNKYEVLALRAVACTATGLRSSLPIWRFLPGMLVKPRVSEAGARPRVQGRVLYTFSLSSGAACVCFHDNDEREFDRLATELLPDFEDELTRLAVLALISAAWRRHRWAERFEELIEMLETAPVAVPQ